MTIYRSLFIKCKNKQREYWSKAQVCEKMISNFLQQNDFEELFITWQEKGEQEEG